MKIVLLLTPKTLLLTLIFVGAAIAAVLGIVLQSAATVIAAVAVVAAVAWFAGAVRGPRW